MDGVPHEGLLRDVEPDNDRYRRLIDSITDYAIYMLDIDGVVTSWNPGAERFKGYQADEILGRNFSVFYTDEDRAAGLPEYALRRAATEGRFEREGWRVRKDGGRFWAHVVIDPILSPFGEVIGYAKVTRDLTERRAAEQALRQSEAQFRLLVQGVTDYAIYLLDSEGRVSNWNSGAQRIKGYLPEEIVGRHFSTFYTEEDRAAGLPQLGLEIARREGRWEHEGWRVRKTGERFWAHVVIDPIRDDKGDIIAFAKVTRDVTERREAQRALDEAREALLQSQKMEAIGQLTGGVAHDFNNLLMAILGSLELVRKRTPNDPRITPLVDNALEGARRGAALTQRMLAFARKQELKLEAVDLEALITNLLSFLQRSIGPTIHIETRFPPNLPRVRTDPAQLESALLNLAVNARDAMPNGGAITISARVDEVGDGDPMLRPGDYVRLQVEDTGEGMDAATLARAAEPFFTTKGVGKGTGLGLSMVHGLAAQSGGRLAIHSRHGEGSTVEVWLPATSAPSSENGRAEDPVSAPAASHRLRILAVDDDPLVLSNTAALLEDLGHHVIEAASGKEALAALKHHPDLDLVITDQIMPQMTGLELRRTILESRPGLPVMIATGYAEMPSDADRRAVRIAKPFTQDALAGAIQEVMSGHASG